MSRLCCALFALVPAALGAQGPDTVVITRPQRDGPTPAERRAASIYNAPGTMRVLGSHTIGRNMVVDGAVAVVDGPLRVEGRIAGDLVAINADIEIADGADIEGDVLVLGGHATVSGGARISGTLEQHTDRLNIRFEDDRLVIVERRDEYHRIEWRERRFPRRSRVTGRASLVLTSAGIYNRVEGLPIYLGPRLSWHAQDFDARLEGLGIFRTAASFDLQNRDVGYRALGRVRFGPRRLVELAGRAFDQVMPIEDWQLRDDEVGWASLLLHRDYRDYFLARGVGAYGRLRLADMVSVWADASWFDASSLDARDPWTPFRNSQAWRPNPAIDEGRFTEYRAGFEISTLHNADWEGGVRLRGEWLHGIGKDLSPVALPASVRAPLAASGYRYDRAWADLRIYQEFAGGALSLRAAAAGDLRKHGPLPVQRRLSLGGPDPLPGFTFHRFGCNEAVGDPALPALCDRMALFQAEYRTGLSIDVGNDDDDDRGWWGWGNWDPFDFDETHIVLFTDAGAAWIGAVTPKRFNWDVGAGLEIGGFGVYVARALERDKPVRVVLRLHQRF
jgi:hypothetical protein